MRLHLVIKLPSIRGERSLSEARGHFHMAQSGTSEPSLEALEPASPKQQAQMSGAPMPDSVHAAWCCQEFSTLGQAARITVLRDLLPVPTMLPLQALDLDLLVQQLLSIYCRYCPSQEHYSGDKQHACSIRCLLSVC